MELRTKNTPVHGLDLVGRYSKEVRAIPLLSRDDEENYFRRIDSAESEYVKHILSHPDAKSLLRNLVRQSFSREDSTIIPLLESVISSMHRKNAVEMTAILVPQSRFSDGMRKWLDDLPCEMKSTKSVRTSTIWMKKLSKLWMNRIDIKSQFVQANLRLVMMIAHKYARTANSLSFLDLVQDGNIGLMRAVDKFDLVRGNRFSTYAVWWIRHSIKRSLQDCDKTVRIPVHISDRMSQMAKVEQSFYTQFGSRPDNRIIAHELTVPVGKIKAMESVRRISVTSIDAPVNFMEDGYVLSEVIQDKETPSPLEELTKVRMSGDVDQALKRLTEREALVLRMRFGFGFQEHTLQEIATKWGLSRERIRQIEAEALSHLRGNQLLKDYTEGTPKRFKKRSIVSCRP